MSTTQTNIETEDQTVICNVISQRNRFLSLLTPPPRYTPVSPYPVYNKPQLDMRRKAEILQYKKNSTQLYQTTKSKRWSQIVNATSTRYVPCNKDPYVLSPSSACDVPGPLVYLYYDPLIPLYNYSTQQNSFSNFYNNPEIPWKFTIAEDISGGSMIGALEGETEPQEGEEGHEIIEYESTANTLVGTLVIQNIKEPLTTYSFTIPIGLFASGTTSGVPASILEIVQITHASLNVYFYNDTIAGADPTTPPLFSIPITNSLSNTNIMDISMSYVPTITSGNFNCYQYIGNIIIPNIKLNTSYGFLYDFRLYFELSYQPMNNATIIERSVVFGVYFNMPPLAMSANNCIVTPQPNLLLNYLPFTITQV